MIAVTEHTEQAALIEVCAWQANRYPVLHLLFAIPNGGLRHKTTALRLQAEGVKPGVPDLCLPVARRGYHALYIEMKRPRGRVQDVQGHWHTALREQGNCVKVCYSAAAAWEVLVWYLGLEVV